MKKMSLYLDTSVIGGYFDPEFETPTRKLFEYIRMGVYEAYISDITLGELEEIPPEFLGKFSKLLNKIPYNEIKQNLSSQNLSEEYIRSQVVTQKSMNDARHVALATCYRVDIIVSWNFKHLVNVKRIREFCAVNLRQGYNLIDIRSPLEVIGDVAENI